MADPLFASRSRVPSARPDGWVLRWQTGRPGLEALRPEWEAMAERQPQATFVQHPDWFASHLAAHPHAPVGFVSAHRGGVLRAVLGLSADAGGMRRWIWPSHSLLHSPHMLRADITADPQDVTVWAALRSWLDGQGAPRWRTLHLPGLSEPSALTQFLRLSRHGARQLVALQGHGAWLDCSQGEDHALRGVARGFHQNLRRLKRRAMAQGALAYRVVTDPADLPQALDAFLAVEASGWKREAGTAIALDARQVAFYRALAASFGARGRCRIHLLTLDGVPIAAQFGLVSGGQVHLLKIGYHADHTPLAPGHLIMRETIAHACADPSIRRLDFVTNPPWAHLWKPNLSPVHHATLFRDDLIGRAALAWVRWHRQRRQARPPTGAPTDAPEPVGHGAVAGPTRP